MLDYCIVIEREIEEKDKNWLNESVLKLKKDMFMGL